MSLLPLVSRFICLGIGFMWLFLWNWLVACDTVVQSSPCTELVYNPPKCTTLVYVPTKQKRSGYYVWQNNRCFRDGAVWMAEDHGGTKQTYGYISPY
jgi:hypothetical protein